MKTELVTVPNFTFHQGDPFNQDENSEYPIEVRYYRYDTITLEQNGNSIVIKYNNLKSLFKEIAGHNDEAQEKLKK